MKVVGVLATHYHPDHVGGDLFGIAVEGLRELMGVNPVPVHAHKDEAEGIREACVTPGNSCVTGTESCQGIEVLPAAKTVFPPVELCWEDAPGYVLPWGVHPQPPKGWSVHVKKFPQPFACDSILVQKVFITHNSLTTG